MINEISVIDDVILESQMDVYQSILESYVKCAQLYCEACQSQDSYFVQEAATPERKNVFQKIIMFIPDLLRKLFQFIKSKVQKLFKKSKPEQIEQNVVQMVEAVKKDNKLTTKIAAGIGAGCAVAASAAGIIIYNKHKKKLVEVGIDKNRKVVISTTIDLSQVLPLSKNIHDVSMKICDVIDNYTTSNAKDFDKLTKQIESVNDQILKFTGASSGDTDHEYIYSLLKLSEILKAYESAEETSGLAAHFTHKLKLSEVSPHMLGDNLRAFNNACTQFGQNVNQFTQMTNETISFMSNILTSQKFISEKNGSAERDKDLMQLFSLLNQIYENTDEYMTH